jgi:hypothetical protein
MRRLILAAAVVLLLLLALAGPPPPWLLAVELALFTLGALVHGFTGHTVRVPAWVMSTPFRGVVFIALGLMVVYVPIQFVLSAYLLGSGARMLWLSVCADPPAVGDSPPVGRPEIALTPRPGTVMTARPAGAMRRVP